MHFVFEKKIGIQFYLHVSIVLSLYKFTNNPVRFAMKYDLLSYAEIGFNEVFMEKRNI